jgi:hypothetical protein
MSGLIRVRLGEHEGRAHLPGTDLLVGIMPCADLLVGIMPCADLLVGIMPCADLLVGITSRLGQAGQPSEDVPGLPPQVRLAFIGQPVVSARQASPAASSGVARRTTMRVQAPR